MKKLFLMLAALIPGIVSATTADITIVGAYSKSATILAIPTAQAVTVENPTSVGSYSVTVYNSSLYGAPTTRDSSYEIMRLTGKATSGVTVTRGYGSTQAHEFKSNYTYKFRMATGHPTLTPTPVPNTPTETPTTTDTLTPTHTFTPTPYADIIVNTGAVSGAVTGWAVNAASDDGLLATMGAATTAGTLKVPLTNLKVGQTIYKFFPLGQIDSGGNTITVTFDLRKQSMAVSGHTDASIRSQSITVWADTGLDNTVMTPVPTPQYVSKNASYYVLITGTTAATTDIELQAIGVRVDP